MNLLISHAVASAEELPRPNGVLELLAVRQIDMHGMKRHLSVLDVKTYRIYHTESAGKGIGD